MCIRDSPKAQAAASKGLGNQRGAVVALNPKTGAILAMVSHPEYDPNALATHSSDDAVAAMTALNGCLLYTSPSPRDRTRSRMPSSA